MQVDLQSIEELIYGKLNEPPSAFVKLIDAIFEILPDAEVKTEPVKKIEELEEPAGPIERIEEPLPAPAAPTAEKRSLAAICVRQREIIISFSIFQSLLEM